MQRRMSLSALPSAVRRLDVGEGIGWLRMRVTAMVCRARLRWRPPGRLRRCRSVRPEDTGTGVVPDREGHREPCFGGDPAGVGPGQQDLRGAERAEAELGCDDTRGDVRGDLGDLPL